MSSVPLTIRPMAEGDRPFIGATLARSIIDLPNSRWVPGGIARRLVVAQIDEWLERYPARVAAAECDPDQILGFCMANSREHVLYIYVKEGLRRMGVGWALIHDGRAEPPASLIVLHWSRHCELISPKYRLKYRPSLLGYPPRREEGRPPRPSGSPRRSGSPTCGSPSPSTGLASPSIDCSRSRPQARKGGSDSTS